MANCFEVKDKRGIKIYCVQEQWDRHIISNHSIMKNNIPAVKETLKDPDYIYESKDSKPPLDYREVFSKKAQNSTYSSSKFYTHVVVAVVGGSGEVITAYPTKNPAGGTKGEALYSKKDEN